MELTLNDEGTHTLFGNHDENLRMLEDEFSVKISSRGGEIFVTGTPDNVAPVEKLLAQMQELIDQLIQTKLMSGEPGNAAPAR